MERKKYFKAAAICAAAGLSYIAMDAAVDYDNDVNPSVGEVTAHSNPERICGMVGKVYSCHWEYWLYVDGCIDLPENLIEEAKSKDESWKPQKGWVDVSGNTWANTPDGVIISFKEKSFLNSIELFGLDRDKPTDC